MTQEDKELLLKDLCARLPYGVKVLASEDMALTLRQIDSNGFCECWENEDIKCHSRWMIPYLRPMESMSKEEVDEFTQFDVYDDGEYVMPNYKTIDWLNAHHFDYRGLIEKGLAIEVTEGMYKEEQ